MLLPSWLEEPTEQHFDNIQNYLGCAAAENEPRRAHLALEKLNFLRLERRAGMYQTHRTKSSCRWSSLKESWVADDPKLFYLTGVGLGGSGVRPECERASSDWYRGRSARAK